MRICYFSVAALAFSAQPAAACAVMTMPPERLGVGYARGTISSVAVVRITGSKYVGNKSTDAHPWEASARVERIVRGSNTVKEVRFSQGWGSSACDLGFARPRSGAQWVVYFWNQPGNGQQVWQAFPLRVALEAERELRARKVRK